MNEQIVTKIEQLEAEVERLSSLEFVQRAESQTAWARQASIFLGLPFLRGYWPHGAFQSGNIISDISGHGLDLTMNAGTQPFMTIQNSVIPSTFYLASNSNFASRASEADFQIIGTEADVDSTYRGLTIGTWIKPTTVGFAAIVGKWNQSANQKQYSVGISAGDKPRFRVSTDGSAVVNVDFASTISSGAWYLLIGRYDPSASIKIWVNGVESENTTSIPATLYSGLAQFEIGKHTAISPPYFDGIVSSSFLCAGLLTDAVVNNIWQTTRGLYGV